MADVGRKVISGNDYNNGGIVVYADMLGNYEVVNPDPNQYEFVSQTGILDTRLDDPLYYSA